MTLEFIVSFPIVLIASVAIFEFLFLLIVIEGAATALHEGVREAAEAYPGSTADMAGANNDVYDNVVAVMNEHLEVYGVEIVDALNGVPLDRLDKQNASIRVEYAAMAAVDRGDGAAACTRVGPASAAGEVVVTLCFALVDGTTADDPVPDWLSTFGFSFLNCEFEMSARHSLE